MTICKLELVRTFDADLIRNFLIQDEIWHDFADDMSVKDNYYANVKDSRSLYLAVMDGDKLAGTVLLKNVNLNTLDVHPCLLKEYRPLIMDVFDDVFKLFLNTPSFINKMVVTIPFCRKIVYNTAIKKGFILEGVNRKSYLKGGIFHDQWMLGLTREEIRGLIWQI